MNDLPATIPALLQQLVSRYGDHPALVTRGESLTYRELEQRSAQMAQGLLAAGAGKGSRIALMAPDGVLWITTYLASLRIGALITVVSTLCTPKELAHILSNSDTQFVVATRGFLRHDYTKTLCSALPGLEFASANALGLAAAPYLRGIWLDNAEGVPWASPVAALLSSSVNSHISRDLLTGVEMQVTPSDDAVIVYTSGSTSLPKAVVHSQSNITRHPPEVAKLFLLKQQDRMMPLLPAFWLGGMVMALEVLCLGATLVYPDSPATEDVLVALIELKVNRVNGWGDMLGKLRDAAIAKGVDVDSIVGLGLFRDAQGELIPPPLQSNMLGMSETFSVHSGEALNVRLAPEQAGASGRTINGFERRVVNPETGLEVPQGEVGELQLRGGALMTGFYKIPREKVFTADGFYPTSDLVKVDDQGYLYFIARRGDMIKTKAANVSRLEVEAALRGLPEVDIPVVAGLDDAEFGQRVVAAVVLKAGASATERSLQLALRESLSSYKVPRNIIFIQDQDIPRTATGKIKLVDAAKMMAQRLS